jgi:Tfp pilus assembly protein PilF
MRIWIFVILIVLLLVFSSCAVHKPASPVTASSEEDYNFYLTDGRLHLKQSDYGKAIDSLKKAVAIKPNSPRAHNLLGIAYFQQKDYTSARVEYENAVDLNTSYALAYNNLGSVHFMLGEFDGAKKMFKKALSLYPELVSAHYSLGTLLVAQGQVEEGTHYLRKGIELSPEFLEKSKAFVADFASSMIGTPELFFTYAKLYASLGMVEKTLEYLAEAKKAGFKDWQRIYTERDFEEIREDQRIKNFKKV